MLRKGKKNKPTIENLKERHNKIEEVSNIRLDSIHKQIVDLGSSISKLKIQR